MQYWIPVQAAIIANLSTEFIMTASFIRFQEMRIDYTDLPKVATKEGKWFPFRRANPGTVVTMTRELFGG